MLTTPSIGIFTFIGYRIMLLIGGAMRTASATTLLFGMAPPEDRTSALAINTIVTGVTSFVTTLAFTPLVSYVQENGNSIFGIGVYAQQLLALISVAIFILVILYYRIFCKNLLESTNHDF